MRTFIDTAQGDIAPECSFGLGGMPRPITGFALAPATDTGSLTVQRGTEAPHESTLWVFW